MPPNTTVANEATALAHHNESLSAIKLLVEQSDKHQAGYRSSLYGALADIFDLTRALVEEGAIEGFVKNHGGDWGKVARNNPFQPIVALAFDGSPAASAISKYALVLKYSRQNKPANRSIPEWIEANGGVEKLATLARSAETPNDSLYDETEEERIERAFHQLQKQQLGQVQTGSGYKAAAQPALREYGRALVRHVGGKLEVVSLLPAGREEIRDDLFKLVPSEPRCARSKLMDKPLYDLFRASDIAARFFGKVKAESVDTTGTQANAGKRQAKKGASSEDRYLPRTGLRFVFRKGKWRADTISVQPTFPVVWYQLTEAIPELDQSKTYYLSSHQVRTFAQAFTDITDWSVRVRANTKSGTYDAAGVGELVFDEFRPESAAWRNVPAIRSQTPEFVLSRERLQELARWPQDYKRLLNDAADVAAFPKVLALSIDSKKLRLQFPNFYDGNVNGLLSKQRALHEARQKSLADFTDSPGRKLTDRYLARSDLDQLCRLSADYGFSFKAKICDFNEENAAIVLQVESVALFVPLRVSPSGDAAGIAELMKAGA